MTTESKWLETSKKLLEGRKIVLVRYMNNEEAESLGWTDRPIVLQLDDGNIIFPSSDDEGNSGGSIFTTDENTPVIPVMR